VLFEIPANVLMKKFTPHAWLAGNMVFFGFVTIMQGLVKSYSGLLATRFFLGVFGKFNAHRMRQFRAEYPAISLELISKIKR
jgi:hypothetical protein